MAQAKEPAVNLARRSRNLGGARVFPPSRRSGKTLGDFLAQLACTTSNRIPSYFGICFSGSGVVSMSKNFT